jgi:hypothetical protein
MRGTLGLSDVATSLSRPQTSCPGRFPHSGVQWRSDDVRGSTWFSGARLTRVPRPEEIASVVGDVASYWATLGLASFEPAEALALLGWEVRQRSLVTAACRHRSMLIPMLTGGFVILVDRLLLQEASRPAPVALAHALAHEIAHSFFYAEGAPPERLFPLEPSEELFCDAFAVEIL